MASIKRIRRRAREGALALLYSSDITEVRADSIMETGSYPDDGVSVSEYAERLIQGVVDNLAEIDERLASTSENWAVERMPVVDRAILRIAVYEMLFVDEVPVSVAINEAVELAKLYGGEDESSRFVNGVLGRIARSEGEEAPDEAETAQAPADVDDEAADADAVADVEDDPTSETTEVLADDAEQGAEELSE